MKPIKYGDGLVYIECNRLVRQNIKHFLRETYGWVYTGFGNMRARLEFSNVESLLAFKLRYGHDMDMLLDDITAYDKDQWRYIG